MSAGEALVKWVVLPAIVVAMLPVFIKLITVGVLVVAGAILCVGSAVALVTYLNKTARAVRPQVRHGDLVFPPTPVRRPRAPRRAPHQ
jgi:hypothetical protein